jgi:hypothetical protein
LDGTKTYDFTYEFFTNRVEVDAENILELNLEINQLTKPKPWLIVG